MRISIPANRIISNFFKAINLNEKYSRKIINHLTAIITAMAVKGFTAKMTDIEEVSEYHRTTISRFLSSGRWDCEPIKSTVKQESFQRIQQLSKETKAPMFAIFDDTVNVKTKPSSRASRPIEKAEFHYSHLLRKQAWGHQVMAAMLSCGKMNLNYDIHRYDKTKQSKMDYAQELTGKLSVPETPAYFLTDSWYANAKIINACAARGYQFIGAMKTNRIIYPKGIPINTANFADKYIEKKDVDLVTVNGKNFCVYRYEGKLNGISNAVVLLSWRAEAFKNPNAPQALRAFICTDLSLDTGAILQYYAKRWRIETFFEQIKGDLGFGEYQIRSIKGIERLWTIMSLCHLLCSTGLESNLPFGVGLLSLRKNISKEKIIFICQSALKRVPIMDICDLFA